MDLVLHGDVPSFDTARKLAALSSVLDGNDAVTSVIAADKAVFTMRESAAVAEGDRNDKDAVENLIDRTAVHVTVWAQERCVRVCEQGGEKIGAAIGKVFGPVGAKYGAEMGRKVGRLVGEELKPVVETGVKIIADAAKSLWREIKESCGKIWSGITNAASTVAGWFGF